jgi:Mrp family chromosome partitioning ATPase/capsular polysaccharide biosynthesis protein
MNDSIDAKTAFAPIWKRKWLILAVGLLVGAATYAYYHHQQPVYASSTELYLGGNAEVQALLGDGQGSATERERTLANQVSLINSSLIGERVIHQLAQEGNLKAASGFARASAAEGSDFIFITTEAGSGRAAADLANAYAEAFQETQKAKDRRNLLAALTSTRQQLAHAEAQETTSTAQTIQVQELLGQISQLRVQLTLNNAGIQQIGTAGISTVPQSPKPARNAIFGLVLGLVLAAFAAYGMSRFDRRLRSLADVARVFDSPLLAAIPSIRNPIAPAADGLPQPAAALREPLRRLHATLQLQGTSEDLRGWLAPRSILFISPDSGDGKSTLAAGLALVESEAGAQAAIVEANLRHPMLGRLLGLGGTRGLAEVLGGSATMHEAIQTVQATPIEAEIHPAASPGAPATGLRARQGGSAALLAGGGRVDNPPALLSGRAMSAVLQSTMEDFDYVLVDAPSPLEVGDALPLMSAVDAIVIVARVGHTREVSAQRLVDLLSRVPHAPIAGTVANGASAKEIEASGFSSPVPHEPPRST